MATISSSILSLSLAINLVLFSYTSATPCATNPTPKPYQPGTGGKGGTGGGINVGVGGGNVGGIIGGGTGGGIVGGGNGGGIINVGGGGVNVGGGNVGGVVGGSTGGIIGGGGSSCGGCPSGGSTGSRGKCPIDTLKLGACANVLNGLINAVVGKPPKTPCCTLIQGLADLEAAVCLCTAIKANILGIKLNVPVSLSLLVNYCGKKVPSGFVCP